MLTCGYTKGRKFQLGECYILLKVMRLVIMRFENPNAVLVTEGVSSAHRIAAAVNKSSSPLLLMKNRPHTVTCAPKRSARALVGIEITFTIFRSGLSLVGSYLLKTV
jgi:hypothetical protein